jgi:RIO kinase 1
LKKKEAMFKKGDYSWLISDRHLKKKVIYLSCGRDILSEEKELVRYSKMRKLEQKLSKIDKRDRMLEKDRTSDLAVLEEVFDRSTLTVLYRLLNKGVIDRVFGAINSGKESRIYRGLNSEGENIALKIYLTSAKEFRKGMLPYIQGDPRFRLLKRDTRSLIYTWAQKEFKNLQRAHESGVRVPKPLSVNKNVLIMEFIGEDDVAAPTLKDDPPRNPRKTYNVLLQYIKILYQKAKLVHGDLSEYNVMNLNDQPVLFDLSQTVSIEHPRAKDFLKRDLRNINRFFQGLGVKVKDVEDAFRGIVNDG